MSNNQLYDQNDTPPGLPDPKDCFQILEIASIGVFTSTFTGDIISANPALARIYGYTEPQELIAALKNITAQHFADPADKEEFVLRLEENGKIDNYEYRLFRRDGLTYWVSCNIWGVRDPKDNFTHYQGVVVDITDRKSAMEAFLENRNFLNSIIESSPTPFFSMDTNYRYTSFNKAHAVGMKELYGADVELGHSLYDYQDVKEDKEKSKSNLDRALRGEHFTEEAYAGRNELSRYFIEVTHNPIRDENGRVTGVSVYTHDITGRKQAEEKLKRTKQFLEGVFNAIQDGITVLDTEMNILSVNEQMRKWYPNIDPLEGEKCYVVYQGRPERCESCPAFRSLTSGKHEMEEVSLIQDGVATGTLQVYAFPIINDNGKPVGAVEYIRNITKQKQAEEKRQESEEKYRSLVEQSVDMMYLHDLEGNFLDVNQASVSVTGYTRQELLTMNVFDLHPTQNHSDKILHKWKEMITGRHITLETIHRRKDGSTFPVEIKAGKIRIGNHEYILALIRDITRRKHIEEALKKANETLEHRVTERTRLAETRTRQLQSLTVELIEAEERERQRIAEILHDDLQQILAAAKLHLQTIRHEQPAINGLEQIDDLLKQSIDRSRLLTHELSPSIINHSSLYTALKWLAEKTEDQLGLKVYFDSDAVNQPESKSLKAFLFRAVQELLFNISKHAGVDRADIFLSSSDKILDITVSDQGKGFNPEILEWPDSKTGLGLLSMRERARTMGGSLLIESAPGKGSIFKLSIPLDFARAEKNEAAETMADRKPNSHPGDDMSIDGEAIRVLFVDDHKVMRQGLIQLIAGQPNIQIAGEAATGREAIEQVRILNPDVVVMDALMPEMNGVEATQKIKAQWPRVRVIGLSMLTDDYIAQEMCNAGAEIFLRKTVSPAELLKAIYGLAHEDQ